MFEDDVYKTQITYVEGRPFFHVDVKKKLSKSDVKSGRMIFEGIKAGLLKEGYDVLYAVTPSPHFARLIGPGCEHIEFIMLDGTKLEMIAWELK